jgi:hypothetical protein
MPASFSIFHFSFVIGLTPISWTQHSAEPLPPGGGVVGLHFPFSISHWVDANFLDKHSAEPLPPGGGVVGLHFPFDVFSVFSLSFCLTFRTAFTTSPRVMCPRNWRQPNDK